MITRIVRCFNNGLIINKLGARDMNYQDLSLDIFKP